MCDVRGSSTLCCAQLGAQNFSHVLHAVEGVHTCTSFGNCLSHAYHKHILPIYCNHIHVLPALARPLWVHMNSYQRWFNVMNSHTHLFIFPVDQGQLEAVFCGING